MMLSFITTASMLFNSLAEEEPFLVLAEIKFLSMVQILVQTGLNLVRIFEFRDDFVVNMRAFHIHFACQIMVAVSCYFII